MRLGLAAVAAATSMAASVAFGLPALTPEPARPTASSPLPVGPRDQPSPRDDTAVVGRDNREPRPTIAPSIAADPPATELPPPPTPTPERASGPSSDREPARESGKPATGSGAAQRTVAPEPTPPPPPPPPPEPAPQTEAAFKAWAQARVPADQWTCLDLLWESESGWSHTADNPTSTAYGIPQALTGLHDLPDGYMTDGYVQMRWGLAYIRAEYGTPCAAWSFKRENGWY